LKRAKVLIIHTGGTLGMAMPEGQRLLLGDDEHLARLMERVPELGEIADITLLSPWNSDSSDVAPGHWKALAELIVSRGGVGKPGGYTGVVIIHGTDTMSYAASMLAFMLRNLDRPVIFTGSQRPLDAWRTDARANLAAAVECACQDLPEVAIVFGDSVLRACRSSKIDARSYNAFAAPSFGTLGRIGTDLDLVGRSIRRPAGNFELRTAIDSRILALTLFPGIDTAMVAQSVRSAAASGQLRALIIRGFGVGNVPISGLSDLRPLLAESSGSGLAVIISSQCYRGHTDLTIYPGGRAMIEAGAIAARDMTFEATITKAMWALAQPEQTLGEWFSTDLAGEVSLD
jgi:L-asparaginase